MIYYRNKHISSIKGRRRAFNKRSMAYILLVFLFRFILFMGIVFMCIFVGKSVLANHYFRTIDGIPHLPVFNSTNDVTNPEAGSVVYSISDRKPMVYSGSSWDNLCTSNTPAVNQEYFKVEGGVPVLSVLGSEPTVDVDGSMYYSSADSKIKVSEGTGWSDYGNSGTLTTDAVFLRAKGVLKVPVLSDYPLGPGIAQGAFFIREADKLLYYHDGITWLKQNCMDPNLFITRWNLPAGPFTLPVHTNNTYNCEVDWGDNSSTSTVTSGTDADLTHNYASAGIYDIVISGTFSRLYINNGDAKDYLIEVVQWGNVGFRSFARAFYGCSKLVSLPSGEPIPTDNVKSFYNCFRDCINLTTLPLGLFAYSTKGTNFSYCFSGCTSLQQLPHNLFKFTTAATTFSNCFNGCTGLTALLPAMFANCTKVSSFTNCFSNCSALTIIPENIFEACLLVTNFSNCFQNCTGITSIPDDLFADSSSVTNYRRCFVGCENLASIPASLFASSALVTDFTSCFQNCLSLASIPTGLFDTCSEVISFKRCFTNCDGISDIPSGLFDACTKVTDFSYCFDNSTVSSIPNGLFDNCSLVTDFSYCFRSTHITAIPANLFDNCAAVTTFKGCFNNCKSISSIPAGLFVNNTLVDDFEDCFRSCTSLTSVPTGLFDNCTAVTDFEECFRSCAALTSIPAGLFDNCAHVSTFKSCFRQCRDLDGDAPELWLSHSTANGTDCFYNCTGLDNYASIPASWK